MHSADKIIPSRVARDRVEFEARERRSAHLEQLCPQIRSGVGPSYSLGLPVIMSLVGQTLARAWNYALVDATPERAGQSTPRFARSFDRTKRDMQGNPILR